MAMFAMMGSRSALCCLWLATHAGVPANTQGGNLPQITAFEYKDLTLAKYECSGTYPGAWDSDIIQIGGSLETGLRRALQVGAARESQRGG